MMEETVPPFTSPLVMYRDYSLIKISCRSLPAGWRQHTCGQLQGELALVACWLLAAALICFCRNKCWISKWDVCENNNTDIDLLAT